MTQSTDSAEPAPSVHFDHHEPEFAQTRGPSSPTSGRCPVAHSETYGGFWW